MDNLVFVTGIVLFIAAAAMGVSALLDSLIKYPLEPEQDTVSSSSGPTVALDRELALANGIVLAFEKRENSAINQIWIFASFVGGLAGIVTIFLKRDDLRTFLTQLGDTIATLAYAASGDAKASTNPRVADAAPYFLAVILLIMGIAFLSSLYVAFTTSTGRGTLPRRHVASTVLKMSG